MLTAIKLYALCSLLFSAGWAWCGYRHNRRREIAAEYRWHMSPIYLHEPQDVIRAKELI